MSPAEQAWEKAKADIPRHDAQFNGVLYELDGNRWLFNTVTGRWECQCRHCSLHPSEREALVYSDLVGRYTVSDWAPARAA